MGTVAGTLSVLVIAVLIGGAALLLRAGQGLHAPGPRLSADLPAALLLRAGFPVTGHNVAAVGEWLATRFTREADDAGVGIRVRAVADAEAVDRAQQVLDAIAEADPAMAVRLVSRVPAELLATAGTGRGLLGGSVFEPLALEADAPSIPAPRTPVLDVAPVLDAAPVRDAVATRSSIALA